MTTASGSVPEAPVETRNVRLTFRSAALLVGAAVILIMGRRMFSSAHRVLGWAVASVVFAALVDPVVDRLARHIRRVPAVLLTLLAVGLLITGGVYAIYDDVSTEVRKLQDRAPASAARLETRDDRIGQVARDLQLSTRVQQFVNELDERVGGGGQVLASGVGTVPTYLVSAILAVFLMTYGPRLVRAGLDQDRDEGRRAMLSVAFSSALVRARVTIWAALGEGLVVGVATWIGSRTLDLPAPAALGLIAGVIAMLPVIGLMLAAIPVALLTVAERSATAAVVVLVVFLVVQVLEVLFIRPVIDRHGVATGPLVPWAVAMLGFGLYGLGAAGYGMALAIFALGVADSIEAHRSHPAAVRVPPQGSNSMENPSTG